MVLSSHIFLPCEPEKQRKEGYREEEKNGAETKRRAVDRDGEIIWDVQSLA